MQIFYPYPYFKVEHLNLIHGVRIGRNGPSFTHLLFADDSLLFFTPLGKLIL